MKIKHFIGTAVLSTLSLGAHAGMIVGGSTLLNNTGLTQLETWLGEGELTLTNVFTKTPDSYAPDFHAAADNKGRTFTLFSASEDNGTTWKTVGGYNPLSWNQFGNTVIASDNPSDWTAFIFNLSDSIIRRQSNTYQTFNSPYYGPIFGNANDVYVNYQLNKGLSYGANYGNGGTDIGKSIVDNSLYDGTNMLIGALEVFTIADYTPVTNDVPEPGSIALLGVGLLGFALSRRKSKNHQTV